MPGTVTLLCGPPGATKSFFLLEACAHWHGAGIPFALLELEEDRTFHLTRALAQESGTADMTDLEWIKTNPGAARQIYAQHRAFLASFGASVWENPDASMTLAKLGDWIEARAAAGARVIAVDPITAADDADRQWAADKQFLLRTRTIGRTHGASIVFVTHPKKGASPQSSLDDLAGGAAYQRFAQTILWLDWLPKREEMQISDSFGVSTMAFNRILRIRKARNGKGAGQAIGFDFDHDTLCLKELGQIVQEKARKQRKPDARPRDGKD